MKARKYQESDFEQIQEWGKSWGATYDKDLFPPIGFIVPGICAYFLYETPSKVCWLENMVRNKEIPKEIANMAIETVVTEILREANSLGYKVCYATTSNEEVIQRAIKHKAVAIHEQTQLQLRFR